MASIVIGEEEKIILSTIYDYVAQYPILKYEGIYHSNPKYINIKVDKIYTYQNSIIVDIEYVTVNNKNIISYELNQDNNIIYTSCDVDSNFIKDIMFLPVYYKFLYIYANIFSDINDGPMFGDDVMYSSEESTIRFLKNGSICVVENSNNHKYNKNIEFIPLYIVEYLMQGCYLDAIQIQSDIKELRRQSEENIDNWRAINS